jgi:hypothetical protein
MADTDWFNEMNTISSGRKGSSLRRSPDRDEHVKRVHAVFALVGLIAGVAGAVWAYNAADSIALAIFVYLVVHAYIGRGLGDVATDPEKGKRFVYFTLHAALAVGVFYLTYQWWETMWLSAVLGVLVGAVLWGLLGAIFFTEIQAEEGEDSKARWKSGGL